MLGIYAYFDKKDNSVVYIGKDSNIDKNVRKYAHMKPSNYHNQQFNKVLQNNPNRYTYQVLVWNVKDQETLNALEIQNIRQLKPKFNYTDGGDGICGFKHSDENKKKMSKAKKGRNNPSYKPYARVIKGGFDKGKQLYVLKYDCKRIKQSIFKDKLEEEANYLNGVV